MKRFLVVLCILVLTVACVGGLVSCGKEDTQVIKPGSPNNTTPEIVEDLLFTLNSNGLTYRVSGVGSKELKEIEIPSTYKDKPVTVIGQEAFADCLDLQKVTIPNSITTIGSHAFANCDSLLSITIPSSVTSIDEGAFAGCYRLIEVYNLSSLNITEKSYSNGEIGYYAEDIFVNANAASNIVSSGDFSFYVPDGNNGKVELKSYNGSSTSITLPNNYNSSPYIIGDFAFYGSNTLTSITISSAANITSVGTWAFKNCSALTQIVIPAKVTSIGDSAFYGCEALGNMALSANLKSIGDNAFEGCASMTSLTIGSGVISIGVGITSGCDSLTTLAVASGNLRYVAQGNCLIDNNTNMIIAGCAGSDLSLVTASHMVANFAFSKNTGITSLTISNNITDVGDYAFSECSAITSLTIGTGLSKLKPGVFSKCTGLTSITIPSNITILSEDVFSGCANLSSVTMQGVVEVGYAAFSNCTSLSSITLPNSVTSVGMYAFSGCSSLSTINIGSGLTNIGYYAFSNCEALTSITLPNTVTTISSFAFTNSGLTSINTNAVSSIGSNAFSECDSLASITLGNGITSITNSMFDGCSALTSITISSATSIGTYAFNNCTRLASITIPNTVTSIGEHAFNNCTGLTSVTLGTGISSIPMSMFAGCTSLKRVNSAVDGTYTIPENITTLSNQAFYKCTSLTNLEIPSSVTSIGLSVFAGCSGLASITVGGSNTIYSSSNNCLIETASNTLIVGCKNSSIPNTITSIGQYAFSGCTGLNSITIPSSISAIGIFAFDGCTNLAEVYNLSNLPIQKEVTTYGKIGYYATAIYNGENTVEYITDENGYKFLNDDNVYYLVSYEGSDTNLTLPNNCLGSNYSIYARAFYNRTDIKSVTLPSTITNIGESAFYGCTGLTSISIPNSVITIGANAFYACSNLVKASIGTGVRNISYDAFTKCFKLVEVYDLSDVVAITAGATTNGNVGLYARAVYTSSSSSSHITTDANGYVFYNDNSTYYLMGYSGSETTLTLPANYSGNTYSLYSYAFYNNMSITSADLTALTSLATVAESAFSGCQSLTTVSLPTNITSIGAECFHNCILLGNVTIPATVTSIGASAFYDCRTMTTFTFPNGVTELSENVLASCTSLTSITLPSNLTTIGNNSISNCTSLTTITIPTTVTSIGNHSFAGCSVLARFNSNTNGEFVVPDSVNSIGIGAFAGCVLMTDLTLPFIGGSKTATVASATTLFGYIFGVDSYTGSVVTAQRYSDGSGATYYVPSSLETVTITGGQVLYGAFYGCSIENVILETTATSIGNYAFYNCKKLISATIQSTAGLIGNAAFYGCSSLPNITIPTATTSIGLNAFATCTNLTQVILGSGVTTIRDNAFLDCFKLVEVYDLSSAITVTQGATSDGYIGFYAKSIYSSMSSPSTLSTSDGYVFYNNSGECYLLGYAGNSTTITLPDNCGGNAYAIFEYAFYNCSQLTAITIPSTANITSIGEYAFNGCDALAAISIPGTVTNIGANAFLNCYALIRVDMASVASWCGITFGNAYANPVYYAHNLYLNNQIATEIVIPGTIESINDYAFTGASELATITINSGVTSIGREAFAGCSDLASIVIPSTVETVGTSAFARCSSLSFYQNGNINYLGNSTNNYLLLMSVANKNSSSYTIQSSALIIYENAFSGCTSLTSITVPNTVVSIGADAFYGCTNLTTATLSTNLNDIGYEAFAGCSKLINLTIPASVTTIGARAFEYCTRLTNIVIPNNVVDIGIEAFYGCSNLISLTIGTSVESIGLNAFQYCYKLVEVYDLSSNIIVVQGAVTNGYSGYYAKSIYTASGTSNLTTTQDGFIFYEDSDSIYYLMGYTGAVSSLTLPDSYNSSTYVIYDYAFYDYASLATLTIPTGSIVRVGSHAFDGCDSLSYYTSDYLHYLGNASNNYLVLVEVTDQNRTSYTIQNTTVIIADSAFVSCGYMDTLTIPASVTTVGANAFSICSSLTSVVVPDTVSYIGAGAFSGCSGMTSMTLPFVGRDKTTETASDTTLFGYIFGTNSYTNGQYIYQKYGEDGLIYYIPTNLTTAVITGGNILYGAFYNCSNFTSITIPTSGITTIGTEVFSGCKNLEKLNSTTTGTFVIPNSVTSIGSRAFLDCTKLKVITISDDTITVLGDSCFMNCSSLERVTIGDCVLQIGTNAFSGCTSLVRVDITDVKAWCNIIFDDLFANPLYYAHNLYVNGTIAPTVTIPNTITAIKDYTFAGGESISSFVFEQLNSEDIITSIGKYSFSGTGIVSITIPSTVTSIATEAFSNCASMTSIVVPNAVTTLGNSAFNGCSSLASITLPFVGTSSTASVASNTTLFGIIFGTNSYTGGTNVTQYYGTNRVNYYVPTTLRSVTITDGSVYTGSFYGCSMLTSITLPSDITSIAKNLFYGCSGLTTITLPNTVTTINDDAFNGCTSLTGITFGSGVTTLGDSVFNGCTGLVTFEIPSTITTIGEGVLAGCTGLTTLTIPFIGGSSTATVATSTALFGYLFGKVEYVGGTSVAQHSSSGNTTTYYVPSSLRTVTITGGKVLYGAFYNCSMLTSITLPSDLTDIADSAFNGCSGITSMTIPSTVTSIGANAFEGCSALTSVTFSDTTGWYYADTAAAVSGTDISVGTAATNATNLKTTYVDKYWKKAQS